MLAAKRQRQSRESSGTLKVAASRSYLPVIYDNVQVFHRGFALSHKVGACDFWNISILHLRGIQWCDILWHPPGNHAAWDNRFQTYWLELSCCFSVSWAATPKSADIWTSICAPRSQSQHPDGIFLFYQYQFGEGPQMWVLTKSLSL